MKYISVKEFREQGYLQELNRRFLHPLGLALSVEVDDDGNEKFAEIWDCRDDPEGLLYDHSAINIQKALNVETKLNKVSEARKKLCGGCMVQPLPHESINHE